MSASVSVGKRHGFRRGKLRAATAVLGIALLVATGCRGRAGRSDQGEPVAECQEYERALSACLHQDQPFATQPALLAKSDADRARIGALCTEKMIRLRAACR